MFASMTLLHTVELEDISYFRNALQYVCACASLKRLILHSDFRRHRCREISRSETAQLVDAMRRNEALHVVIQHSPMSRHQYTPPINDDGIHIVTLDPDHTNAPELLALEVTRFSVRG